MKSIQHFIRQSYFMFTLALLCLSSIILFIYGLSIFDDNSKRFDEVSFRISIQLTNGIRNVRNNLLIAETLMLDQIKNGAFDNDYASTVLASTIFYNMAQYDIYLALSEKYARELKGHPAGQMLIVTRTKFDQLYESNKLNEVPSQFLPDHFATASYTHDLYYKNKTETWYHDAVKNKGKLTYINTYFDKNYTRKWLFSLTRAAYNKSNELIGVLGIDYAIDLIFKVFKDYAGDLGLVIFEDLDGRVVMHLPSKNLALLPPNPNYNLYVKSLEKTKEELIEYASRKKFIHQRYDDNWIVYKVYKLPYMPWHLIVYQPAQEFYKALLPLIAILLMAGILFLLAFYYFLRKNKNEFLPPLQNLIESLERDVNYVSKYKSISGKYNESNVREISEIVRSINTLFEVVNENFQKYQTELEKNEKYMIELESLVKKRSEQLVEREKLASLGVMTAGLAHEIKNPLNLICNAAEVVAAQVAKLENANIILENEVAERLKKIKEGNQILISNGKRVDNIIKTLVMQSSMDKEIGNQKLNMVEAIESNLNFVLSNNRPKINNLIEVNFNKPDHDIIINCEPASLGRVFINIFDNSIYSIIKKMEKTDGFKGRIDIELKEVRYGVEFKIRDNGSGADSILLKNAFTPFFTTKPPGEGTGLGLSYVYEFIKNHNGTIELKAKKNEFFEIIVYLKNEAGL